MSPLPVAKSPPIGLGATEMTVVARYPVSTHTIRKGASKVHGPACVTLPEQSGLLTRVLVTLEHQLRVASSRVPELHSSILGAAQDPSAVRGESNTQNKVLQPVMSMSLGRLCGEVRRCTAYLVALKRSHAFPTPRARTRHHASIVG